MGLFKRKRTNKRKKPGIEIKKQKNEIDIQKFKDKYYSFYDDIKDYTRGKEDW